MAERSAAYLAAPLTWDQIDVHLLDHPLETFEPLMQRIDAKVVKKMVEANQQPDAAQAKAAGEPQADANSDNSMINIKDFQKLELRIGRIAAAQTVEGSDKLLRLEVDLGPLGRRQIFSGIKSAYDPAILEGRLTLVLVNLAPRKMRFGVSEGMVLAAGEGDEGVFLLAPDSGAEAGMRVT